MDERTIAESNKSDEACNYVVEVIAEENVAQYIYNFTAIILTWWVYKYKITSI